MIRVAIVDDHPIVRDGTAAVLGAQPGIEVAGTASSVDEAIELIGREAIDVVLLDIRLGTDSGLRLLQEDLGGAVGGRAAPAVVVLSAYDYPQYAEAAVRLGAAGYVIKTAPLPELLAAIERAAAGGMAFSVRPRPGRGSRLSPRELEVVRLVIDGRSNDEIGAALGIGAKTV
ncbi:MAG TPA: response regulator transcription factor, partial [Candidatus Limnocylindrales bacterium]|nr:response regulator transcription factor [Candidatus Limnocylindrales bacterium]